MVHLNVLDLGVLLSDLVLLTRAEVARNDHDIMNGSCWLKLVIVSLHVLIVRCLSVAGILLLEARRCLHCRWTLIEAVKILA